MRRNRPVTREQRASACGLGFSGSPLPRSAAGLNARLAEEQQRSRVSSGRRAHLGNIESEQPGSGWGPGFSGSSRLGLAPKHVPIDEGTTKEESFGGGRAYLGNVG
jgi:hypothetical protein